MRVVISDAAEAKLRSIQDHIAERDPRAAERVMQRIAQVTRMLGDFPKLGAPWDEGSRSIVVSGLPFRIHYRLAGEIVEIITVLHMSQRPFRED